MDAHLRAGIAIYNAGDYHTAHDPWEEAWLELDDGPEERLLHGLIQFTAAIHHARNYNWGGATGLASSALEYLTGLPDDHGVNVGAVRAYLATLRDDPDVIDRAAPPQLTHKRQVVTVDDLEFEVGVIASEAYAAAGGYDTEVLAQAIAYARADLEAEDETSPFVTGVLDFARVAERRGTVYRRLLQRVERREQRERDVEGLFE